MLVIASALSVPDPRDRPLEKQQAADQAHLRFRDERSDFLSLIALWEFFADALAEKLSHRRMVDACRAQFVSYLRLREWRDVHAQLAGEIGEQGWKWESQLPKASTLRATREFIRRCSRACSATSAAKSDEGDGYLGTRGISSGYIPGPGSRRRRRAWVLAAELVETTRLYARCAARIEPEWVEAVAGDRLDARLFRAALGRGAWRSRGQRARRSSTD